MRIVSSGVTAVEQQKATIPTQCPSMRIVSSGVTAAGARAHGLDAKVSVDEDRFKRSHRKNFTKLVGRLRVSVDEDRFKRSHSSPPTTRSNTAQCPSMRIVSSGVTQHSSRVASRRAVSVDEDRFKRSHVGIAAPTMEMARECPSMRIVSSGVTSGGRRRHANLLKCPSMRIVSSGVTQHGKLIIQSIKGVRR